MTARPPNFDLVARPYRWLEYLSFGPYLERCRFHFLPELTGCHRALVFGDGDGRFAARLLAFNQETTLEAVDSSTVMLRLLANRVSHKGSTAERRLRLWHGNALEFDSKGRTYDLVATHFFLDCFTETELVALLGRITPCLTQGTTWLVSEFSIPTRGAAALPARVVVGALYRIFGLLTGLRVRSLPDYSRILRAAGFDLGQKKNLLLGMLVAEIWTLRPCSQATEGHDPGL